MAKFQDIINFWYDEIPTSKWYNGGTEFDELIKERFLGTHTSAVKGELYTWRENPLGRVAEVIVLDQFSRNIYRNDPRSFLYDPMALVLAQEAVSLGLHVDLDQKYKQFLYMPYMHSESKLIHEEAVKLFSEKGFEQTLEFEIKHKVIIDRFERYPHRNNVLGRDSTEEELEFLKGPGSSF